jgi:hypothetical protein
MEELSGGCQCGRVRYNAEVEPDTAYVCHCSVCRKATGGVWAAMISVALDRVHWQGKPDWYQSSAIGHRAFCPKCGTPIGFAYVDDLVDLHLTIGSFDQAERFRPAQRRCADRALPAWDRIDTLPAEHADKDPCKRDRQEVRGEPPA